jgi:hypothetical protein
MQFILFNHILHIIIVNFRCKGSAFFELGKYIDDIFAYIRIFYECET